MDVPEAARSVPLLNGGGRSGGFCADWGSWGTSSFQFRNTSGASSNVFSQLPEAYKGHLREQPVPNKPHPSNQATGRTVVQTVEKKRKRTEGVLGVNYNRWANHNKKSCKCAVCRQLRGDLPSSWYKHDQTTCVCAICRRSRGESRPKREGGPVTALNCNSALPEKKGSWWPSNEPAVERGGSSSELPRYGGLQSTHFIPLQLPTFPPSNTVVKSRLKPRPALPNTWTPGEINLPRQQELSNWTGYVDCASMLGVPAVPNSLLAPTPKRIFDAHHDRLSFEQRLGCSYHAEDLKAQPQALQTTFSSNSGFAGWSSADPTCLRNFTVNNPNVSQHHYDHCSNLIQSGEKPTMMPYDHSTGVPWLESVRSVNQEVASTPTMLQNAGSLETRTLDLPWTHTLEPGGETLSAITDVPEGSGTWSTPFLYSSVESMINVELDAAKSPSGSHQDTFDPFGQNASLLQPFVSSMVPVQPDLAAPSNTLSESDAQAAHVSWKHSNLEPCGLSDRSSSISQFPFGLEVQARVEHAIDRPVGDFNTPIHVESILTINDDRSTAVSSSTPYDNMSPTSMSNEKDYFPQVGDIDLGNINNYSSVILQGVEDKVMLQREVPVGDLAKPQPVKSGYDNRFKLIKAAGQQFSKCSVNAVKGTKKKRVSKVLAHPLPKWRQLIHNKYDHFTFTWKICRRTRVPKKCPESTMPKLLEPRFVNDTQKVKLVGLTLSTNQASVGCRSRLDEPAESSGLQSTDPTTMRGPKHGTAAAGELISTKDEEYGLTKHSINELWDSMLDTDCCRGFAISSGVKHVFNPDVNAKNNQMAEDIRQLNICRKMPDLQEAQHTATLTSHSIISCTRVHCKDHTYSKSGATRVEPFPSYSIYLSLKYTQDLPVRVPLNISTDYRRTGIRAINYHLGRTVQLADPLIQNVVAKFSLGPKGKKRSRKDVETCNQGTGERKQDNLRHLMLQSENMCLPQVTKKQRSGQVHHCPFVSKSFLFTNVESLFMVDSTRNSNLVCKMWTLTAKVLLPGSVNVWYLTHTQRAKTSPMLFINVPELASNNARQPPRNCKGNSLSWVSKKCTFTSSNHCSKLMSESLQSVPLVYSTIFVVQFHILNLLPCRKVIQLVEWLKVLCGLRIPLSCIISETMVEQCSNSLLEISKFKFWDRFIFCIEAREDPELYSRFWQSLYTTKSFSLYPFNRLTPILEDQISSKPLERMTRRPFSLSFSMTRQCLHSFSCDVGQIGANKSAFHGPNITPRSLQFPQIQETRCFITNRHEQSIMHKSGFTPINDCIMWDYLDKPLYEYRYFVWTRMLSERNQLRLLLECAGADEYITFSEGGQTAEGHCMAVHRRLLEGEKDEFEAERQRKEKKLGEGMSSREDASLPVNTLPSGVLRSVQLHRMLPVQRLVGHGEILVAPLQGDCTSTTETISEKTSSASSFQELPVSVLPIASIDSPPFMSNCQCRTDPCEVIFQTHSSNSSPSIPDMDVREVRPVLRSDGQGSAVVRFSTTSTLKPVQKRPKRGCPKGGWPKKEKAQKGKNVPATCNDQVNSDAIISQRGTFIEADFEVLQPRMVKLLEKQGSEYKNNLVACLAKPFELQELKELEELVSLRTPVMRLRETRQRVLHVATLKYGNSYLDYHPDLARKVADAGSPEQKLKLLRGFFFWIQHSCAFGSFKPWAPHVEEADEGDDCVEIYQEEVVKSVHKKPCKGNAATTLTCFQSNQDSAVVKNVGSMTLRSRARKKKPAKELENKKPFVNDTVKKEITGLCGKSLCSFSCDTKGSMGWELLG